MKIYLIGYMGSGKSTLGKILAQEQEMNFIDFDHFLEEKEGKSIAKIFKGNSKLYLREDFNEEAVKTANLNDYKIISFPKSAANLEYAITAPAATLALTTASDANSAAPTASSPNAA